MPLAGPGLPSHHGAARRDEWPDPDGSGRFFHGVDPGSEALHELRHECAGALVCQLAALVEQLRNVPDIGLRLLHRRHIEKHERLPRGRWTSVVFAIIIVFVPEIFHRPR